MMMPRLSQRWEKRSNWTLTEQGPWSPPEVTPVWRHGSISTCTIISQNSLPKLPGSVHQALMDSTF